MRARASPIQVVPRLIPRAANCSCSFRIGVLALARITASAALSLPSLLALLPLRDARQTSRVAGSPTMCRRQSGEANIAVEMFPHDLTKEIKELNRKFIRSCLDSDVSNGTSQGRQLNIEQANYLKESVRDFAGQTVAVHFAIEDAESQT
jgi:hypothetical protein